MPDASRLRGSHAHITYKTPPQTLAARLYEAHHLGDERAVRMYAVKLVHLLRPRTVG